MRRRASKGPPDSELNLTSMLDVIFNILAYFVITFNPPKPERNFDVALPPPKAEKTEAKSDGPDIDAAIFKDFNIALQSGPQGSLAGINLAPLRPNATQPRTVVALATEMQAAIKLYGGKGEDAFEAVNIVAPSNLKYSNLIAVVDACHKAGLHKINFRGGGPADKPPPKP